MCECMSLGGVTACFSRNMLLNQSKRLSLLLNRVTHLVELIKINSWPEGASEDKTADTLFHLEMRN